MDHPISTPQGARALPDVETIKQIFDYDPSTGEMRWASGRLKGEIAGTMTNGYRQVTVKMLVHRLAWKLMTGKDPKGVIDHINRDRSDNRFENLRDVTQAVNNRNSDRGHSGSLLTAGAKGYRYLGGKYHVRICIEGRDLTLGSYGSEEEARRKYLEVKGQVVNAYRLAEEAEVAR